jgi:AraC-like DNA-binding protein
LEKSAIRYDGAVNITRLPVAADALEVIESVAVLAPDRLIGERHLGLPGSSVQLFVRASAECPLDYQVHVNGVRSRLKRKPIGGEPALVIRLAPRVARHIIGVPLNELVDATVSLEQVWSDDGRELRHALVGMFDPAARARLVQAAVLNRFAACHESLASHTALMERVRRLLQSRFAVPSVSHMANELGTSERRLRRAFNDATGLTPKTYLRAVRLRRALALSRGRTWSAAALEAGYFDQAHMIDDFRQLTDRTPAALARELAEVRASSSSIPDEASAIR